MSEPTIIITLAALIGLGIVVAATLHGWHSWLALKAREVENGVKREEGGSSVGAARIEISDLKERIRKLEAIANGVDL